MKTLIVYDSVFGNTKKVAEAIASVFDPASTRLLNVNEAKTDDLKSIDLLLVGSPTYSGRPKPTTQIFLKKIPAGALNGVSVSAFDTGYFEGDQNFLVRIYIKIMGYASPRIAKVLESKGGKLVAISQGFAVAGKKGPLKEGELERAIEWAKSIKI